MFKHTLILTLFVTLLAACSPATPPPVAPTIAVLPSWTPSPTPLPPTATPFPSNTPTPTITTTPTPRPTDTPSPTLTPSITPTYTLTFTPSVTPTATHTPTATPTATSLVPVIAQLQVVPEEAEVGETVQLTWNTEADSVVVDVQNQNGDVIESFNLPPRGSQSFVIPQDARNVTVFRLTAQRSEITLTRSVAVDIGCLSLWFFDASGVVPRERCPAGPARAETGRLQIFEDGVMVWVPQRSRVYALYGGLEGGGFNRLGLTQPDENPPDAPEGFFEPELEFEGVWTETFSEPGNTWEEQVGFGVQPAQSSVVRLQSVQGSPDFYMQVGDTLLFQMQPNGDGSFGSWSRIRLGE